MLSFGLTKKEELVRDVKAWVCLSHSSHELVELVILRGESKGQDHKPRLAGSRLWPRQKSARKKAHGPGEAAKRTN